MTRSANTKIAIAAALVATIASTMPASAWVAYHDAGAWRGPAGGVHTYNNYGVAGAPRYGYGYHYGAWGAPAYGAGAVAAGVAAGAVAGAVVGATVASLPHACAPYGALYACGGVYYQPYYGPTGLVYQVVPAP